MPEVFLPLGDPIFGVSRWLCLRPLDELMSSLHKLIETTDVSHAVMHYLWNFESDFYEIWHLLTINEKIALRRDLAILEAVICNTDGASDARALSIIRPVLCKLSVEASAVSELTYNLYVLNNFRRINPKEPRKMGNLRMIRRFTNLIDEEWLIIIHCACAVLAEQLLEEMNRCYDSVVQDNKNGLIHHLATVGNFEAKIVDDFKRLRNACHPDIYRQQVQPYLGQLDLEENPLFQILSGFYGVEHSDLSKSFVQKMRNRMTPVQVRTIELMKKLGKYVRRFVENSKDQEIKSSLNYARDNFQKICCIVTE